MNIGPGAGAVLGDLSGIGNDAKSIAERLGLTAPSYFAQLRQASFRGIPFACLGGESAFSRRHALHEYPYRDCPWVEDLGKGTRRYHLIGFLVGDDVIQQRAALIAASETQGPGQLVHPTFGQLTVSLSDLNIIERWEKGRYFELRFIFIEGGPRNAKATDNAHSDVFKETIDNAYIAAIADFVKTALWAIQYGAAITALVIDTALAWVNNAKALAGDARNLLQLVDQLPGHFGRFAGRGRVPLVSDYPGAPSRFTTVKGAIQAASDAREKVNKSATALITAARALDKQTLKPFAQAAKNVVISLLNASPDPADGLRLLSQLSEFELTQTKNTSQMGGAIATMQIACRNLFRLLAVIATIQAASTYRLTSKDEAVAIKEQLLTLLNKNILLAGDQQNDTSYQALTDLRLSAINDFKQRGTGLPNLRRYTLNAALPALYVAHRLYQDTHRTDALIAQANPIHPAFMPHTFTALT